MCATEHNLQQARPHPCESASVRQYRTATGVLAGADTLGAGGGGRDTPRCRVAPGCLWAKKPCGRGVRHGRQALYLRILCHLVNSRKPKKNHIHPSKGKSRRRGVKGNRW